jgi:hypothetical protein
MPVAVSFVAASCSSSLLFSLPTTRGTLWLQSQSFLFTHSTEESGKNHTTTILTQRHNVPSPFLFSHVTNSCSYMYLSFSRLFLFLFRSPCNSKGNAKNRTTEKKRKSQNGFAFCGLRCFPPAFTDLWQCPFLSSDGLFWNNASADLRRRGTKLLLLELFLTRIYSRK